MANVQETAVCSATVTKTGLNALDTRQEDGVGTVEAGTTLAAAEVNLWAVSPTTAQTNGALATITVGEEMHKVAAVAARGTGRSRTDRIRVNTGRTPAHLPRVSADDLRDRPR